VGFVNFNPVCAALLEIGGCGLTEDRWFCFSAPMKTRLYCPSEAGEIKSNVKFVE
jgi:hypothetical protein